MKQMEEFDLEMIPKQDGTLVKALTHEGRMFNVDLTGEMADPIMDEYGVVLVIQMCERKGLKVALPSVRHLRIGVSDG